MHKDIFFTRSMRVFITRAKPKPGFPGQASRFDLVTDAVGLDPPPTAFHDFPGTSVQMVEHGGDSQKHYDSEPKLSPAPCPYRWHDP